MTTKTRAWILVLGLALLVPPTAASAQAEVLTAWED